MAPHCSALAWKIPWTEEPGRLQCMGSLRVRHDFTFTFTFHFSLSCTGEGNGNPLQCSCLENSGDGGAWWAFVYGVAQSRTRLKRLSSSSSSPVLYSKSLLLIYFILLLFTYFDCAGPLLLHWFFSSCSSRAQDRRLNSRGAQA